MKIKKELTINILHEKIYTFQNCIAAMIKLSIIIIIVIKL